MVQDYVRRERINYRSRKGLRIKSCLLALRGEFSERRIEVPSEYISPSTTKNQFLVKASKSFGAP